jgi:hypothetical protein
LCFLGEEEKRRKEQARIEYRAKALERLAAIRQRKKEKEEATKVLSNIKQERMDLDEF